VATEDQNPRAAKEPLDGEEIARLWRLGSATWPALSVDLDRFAAFLTTRDGAHDRAADLYLACACAGGDRAAHAAFAEAHRPVMERALFRLVPDRATVDDLVQMVLTLILLDDPPRIVRYSGRGALMGWVAVVASRSGLDALRKSGRVPRSVPSDLARGGAGNDAELVYMKRTYRDALERAIEDTLASMSTRARLMLRYHAVDGLGIDAIARLQGVHRATAARWLSRARSDLVRQTRARLMRAEGLSESEADSVHRLVMSQIDVSIDRLLGGDGP